jgi:tellurite resistance protein
MGKTMSIQAKSHIQMVLQSIDIFANDGKLDQTELAKLMELALRDGQIDAEERRVLNKIFEHAEKSGMDADVRAAIEKIRARQ